MKRITIVVPCYEEADCIQLLYEQVAEIFEKELESRYGFNVLYIDDGSRDRTLEEIKSLVSVYGEEKVKYLSFARNFGKEAALYAGLEKAVLKLDADYIAVMDADLQHPPRMLIQMIQALEQEGYDCAAAKRINRTGEAKIKSFFSAGFYHIINKVTGMNLVSGMTDYRLMKKQVVKAIISMTEKERFIKGIYSWIGFHTLWIEYENVERVAGESKWSMGSLWNYAKSGFIAFAVAPLRGVVYLGMIVVVIALIYAIRVLAQTVFGGRPWTDSITIILLLLFLGGVIITILGIIGEYIARVYLEVKNRPIYITRESNIE